jgi:SAM-dependent methyltransferase
MVALRLARGLPFAVRVVQDATMESTRQTNREQIELWNGAAGSTWVEAQELLDGIFMPIEQRLVDVVSAGSPATVLDIGCGTGSTTLAIARRLGPHSRVIGIDISGPMIALAKARADREHLTARFIRADAQVHEFEPATVDALMSRFGVMFFDDPVRAFSNLRSAAKVGAQLVVVAWRGPDENPFMTTAERAAGPLLPSMPSRQPDAPGQFAFANRERVRAILDASRWTAIDLQPLDVECTFPERELNRYVTRLGPVGMALQDADDATRARVVDAVRAAFDPYVSGSDVRFTAACWMVSARAGHTSR